MSEQLDDVERRLASVRELQDIVGAMLSLAGVRLQQAQQSLPGTRSYAEIVRDTLQRAMAMLPGSDADGVPPGPEARPIVVVFGAEHGFTGAFNRRIVETLDPGAQEVRLVAGTRAATLCQDRGIAVAWATPMATNVGAVTGTARRISAELYRRLSSNRASRIEIVYARYAGGGRFDVCRDNLFPIPRAKPSIVAVPPLLNLPVQRLVDQLIEEYLFGELAHSGMESVASENGARLTTMQVARRNIEDRRTELEGQERALRQEEITVEMLDVITGAAAMTEQGNSRKNIR